MPSPKLAVLFGHSHCGALIHGVSARDCTLPSPADPLHAAIYEVWKFNGNPPYATKTDAGEDLFNSAILATLDEATAGRGDRLFVTQFGGNEHTVISLIRHQRPYDFILPEAPDLPCTPGAEMVPCAYVERILQSLMDRYLYELYLLRRAVPDPILALEPPPVNGDNDYLEGRLDQFFLLNSDIREVAPAPMRLKMRLLQRRLLKRFCDEHGIALLPPPPGTQTPEGFLDQSCYGADATHAGGEYGNHLLRQIEAHTGTVLRSWSTFT